MLRDFDGTTIAGPWTLHITDDTANGEGGALLRWSMSIALASEPEGNLNYDGKLDATDIDILFANLGSPDSAFDLNRDGTADERDVRRLVEDLLGKRFGDVNLDQKIDIADVNVLITNFDPLGTNRDNVWAEGDFDGDGDIDLRDFQKIIVNFAPLGYPQLESVRSNRNAISIPADSDGWYTYFGVPEPNTSGTYFSRSDVMAQVEAALPDDVKTGRAEEKSTLIVVQDLQAVGTKRGQINSKWQKLKPFEHIASQGSLGARESF